MKLKLTILVAIVTILLTKYSVNAQQHYSFLAKQGDIAIQFGLKGLNELSPTNVNGGIGFQYYIINNVALRGILGASYLNEKLEKKIDTDYQNYSLNKYELKVYPGIRFNIAASGALVFYTGVEGGYSYSFTKEIGKNFKDISNETINHSFGAGVFLGAEWFAFRNISISAEYNFSAMWSNGTNIIESSTQKIENKSPDAFNINLGQTKGLLMISFYF